MTRTFSKADWNAAAAAWSAIDLGAEWLEVRRRAALRGMLWPPNGSKWDTWDDDQPSQVAILIRAIRETPAALLSCIDAASSWGEVIGRLIEIRDQWRADQQRRADAEEAAWAATKAADKAGAAGVLTNLGTSPRSTIAAKAAS